MCLCIYIYIYIYIHIYIYTYIHMYISEVGGGVQPGNRIRFVRSFVRACVRASEAAWVREAMRFPPLGWLGTKISSGAGFAASPSRDYPQPKQWIWSRDWVPGTPETLPDPLWSSTISLPPTLFLDSLGRTGAPRWSSTISLPPTLFLDSPGRALVALWSRFGEIM